MMRGAITAAIRRLAACTLALASSLVPVAGAEAPRCTQVLSQMRSELAKRANEMEMAVRDNAPVEQKCRLSAAYLAADEKVLAYMKSNQRRCGIAALEVTQQQAVHDSNLRAKDVICVAPRS